MSGFYCACGGKMGVVDSRPTTFSGEPAVRRRRKCRKCGHRDSTFEISGIGPLAAKLDRARSILASEHRFRAAYADLMQIYDQREAAE